MSRPIGRAPGGKVPCRSRDLSSTATAGARDRPSRETQLTTERDTFPAAEPGAGPADPAGPRATWRSTGAAWVMGGLVVLAVGLACVTYDLLQNRLHEASLRFDTTMLRFERCWRLYDATMEAALAVKWDLAPTTPAPEAASLDADAVRLAAASEALVAASVRPGDLMSAPAEAYGAAARQLGATLASLREAGGTDAVRMAAARAQVQQALDRLAVLGREARQQQALSAVFRDQVEAVRGHVLNAVLGIVVMLALVAVMGTQWIVVARRERAMRRRAEHFADAAEAQRLRAENVARDKGRFLGMLSHELLTPLQSILSTMDVIESRGRVDTQDAAFTRLRESTRSLRGRISDLVDFAKMSSGRLETRLRGFQLDKLIDTALRDVEEPLASKNLDVHWEAGPELSRRVYSDPARLRQIIDNLLTNAVKYTERGGISIQAWLEDDCSRLRVEVSDTGVGIREPELARLFEPFYRSPATAAMAEGSGLGLAVVRSLVDLMGGTVRVDSHVGRGTSVVVEVPVSAAIENVAEGPMRVDLRLPVLVVDDSHDARRAIADVFRALGLDVYEAADGRAGLAEAAERDYQAIVLDMRMPDMSGREVAQLLRRPGGRHERTFLILVSAGGGDLCAAADDDGVFDARIDKPASRKDLMAALARATRG